MNSLPDFSKCQALVVGDIMLDIYLWGDANRISPEAPVPVVKVGRTTYALGGAGNTAANMAGLGCQVTLIGAIGTDWQGNVVAGMARGLGITLRPVSCSATITKTRIMARNQQVVRVDVDDNGVRSQPYNIYEDAEDFDVIVFSDYYKGALKGADLSDVLAGTTPVFVDTKNPNWTDYFGAFCITPNEAELMAAATDDGETTDAETTMADFGVQNMIVTRGGRGMTLYRRDRKDTVAWRSLPPVEIPATTREVYDVSGAGDTVIAVAAAAHACGLDMVDAARLANTAAGVVVGKVGTSPITIDELKAAVSGNNKLLSVDALKTKVFGWKNSGKSVVFTNGCFDLLHPGHIELLRGAAREGDRLVVGLNSDESIRRLKGPSRPVLNEKDRASLLSSLEFVDAVVIFTEDTPLNVVAAVVPDVIAKGGDYAPDKVVGREIVEQAGGRCVIIPTKEGLSTSAIIERMRKIRGGYGEENLR